MRKLLAALIAALVSIFVLSTGISADTTLARIIMHGSAAITSTGQTNSIHMALNSSNDPVWHLELDLTVPVVRQSDGESDNEEDDSQAPAVVSSRPISGSFTLGVPDKPLSTGAVTGTLDSSLGSEITLNDPTAGTSLNMMFAITGSGVVTAIVEGQWPLIPESPPLPTKDAVIPPVATVPAAVTISPPQNTLPAVTEQTVNQPADATPVQPSNSHTYWYLSRTSAMAAYILLFINICLGIGLKTKYLDSMMKRWKTYDLHQFTGILGGALIILHMLSLLGDAYFKFSLSQLLVPMQSPYKPFWTGLGAIALYAGGIIALTSFVRKYIGQKVWRAVHYVSYLLFFVVLFHGIMAGTDTATPWVQWLYVFTGTVVAFLFFLRFFSYRADQLSSPEQVRLGTGE